MGRHDRAVAEVERARELNPISLHFRAHVGLVLVLARRYDEAVGVLQKMLEIDQDFKDAHIYLGYAYAGKGMYPEAIAAYQYAVKLEDELGTQIYLGAAYARAGQREKAQAILKRALRSKEYVSPGELAVLYVH